MLLMKKLIQGEKMYDLLLGLSQLKQKAESIYYLSYLLVLHYGSDKIMYMKIIRYNRKIPSYFKIFREIFGWNYSYSIQGTVPKVKAKVVRKHS